MLQKLKFQPGFNKQVTATGGEGQWVSGDYVRFRYGSPEKIGGWAQLGDITLTGRNTALHHFVNAAGQTNGSGYGFIYMAFAEAPFVNSNGVPNNAR